MFPLFFGQIAREGGLSDTASTAVLGYGNSLFALLLIAILAPVLGTMADYRGRKKRYFRNFLFLGVLSTVLLVLIRPGAWLPAIIIYMLTAVGFAGANIFYDCIHDRCDYCGSNGRSLLSRFRHGAI